MHIPSTNVLPDRHLFLSNAATDELRSAGVFATLPQSRVRARALRSIRIVPLQALLVLRMGAPLQCCTL